MPSHLASHRAPLSSLHLLRTVRLLTLAATSVGVAACSGAASDPGESVRSSTSAISPIRGVDYSFARPSPGGTRAEGYHFAARYLSGDPGSGKDITRGEADDLIGSGLELVLVFESNGDEAMRGYDQGASDARAAREEAASIGAPSAGVIYFAIDFDPTGYESAISSYFDGVASVLGVKRTGAYGGYGAIHELFDAGKISFGWQAYAWSYGEWDGRAQLRQIENGIDGGQEDLDEAIDANFGQWPGGGAVVPTKPTQAPAPLETTAVAINAKGELEAFSRDPGGELFQKAQVSAGGDWSAWSGLGGALSSNAAAALNMDGMLEVFGVGTNREVYHAWAKATGGFSPWASLGGVVTSGVAVGKNADGRLEVFGRGTNDALYHAWQDDTGAWTAWASLGGKITSDPTVVTNADGRLEVFARGTEDVPYHQWQVTPGGGWSGWASLGGKVTTEMSVAINKDGRLEVFAVGTNGEAYHTWQSSKDVWSGWASLGGRITSSIAATRNEDGRLEIFGRGTNDAMFHMWQTAPGAGWSAWYSLGGKLTSNPSVGVNKDGRLELFARTTGGSLDHIWQATAGGAWSAWGGLGGKIQ